MQSIKLFENTTLVGELQILDRNSYAFCYDKSWLENKNSFEIDPLLPLSNQIYYSKNLFGAFMDISPDRWGRLIQSRNEERFLNDSEYMLGVSDYFRVGALRLSVNNEFVASHCDIPTLININAIADSTLRVERDEYSKKDLKILLAPSSSLGGARPKACVQDKDGLYIAKFLSHNDISQVTLWEGVMLELSKIAQINTAQFKFITHNRANIILIKRFDRTKDNSRIPFMSAMTLLGASEMKEIENLSYVLLAEKLDTKNQKELFRRMLFNTLFGNTDDHLRNHALLYDRTNKEWNLSPAYDLNPTPYEYSKQYHALNFIDNVSTPSVELCRDIANKFSINDKQFKQILNDCINAGSKYKEIAIKFGIKNNEIKLYSQNFKHKDIDYAKQIIGQSTSIVNINTQETTQTNNTHKSPIKKATKQNKSKSKRLER